MHREEGKSKKQKTRSSLIEGRRKKMGQMGERKEEMSRGKKVYIRGKTEGSMEEK